MVTDYLAVIVDGIAGAPRLIRDARVHSPGIDESLLEVTQDRVIRHRAANLSLVIDPRCADVGDRS